MYLSVIMNISLLFQIAGSLAVLFGYYLNSKSNVYQHFWFILGHIFLIGFTIMETKPILLLLSVCIIFFQYRISKRKWRFKKNVVRVKKIVKSKPLNSLKS